MGRKAGKYKKKENGVPKKSSIPFHDEDDDMINDDIDAFHKQRDVVPLDMNDDIGDSDEDDEQPVFDFKEDKENEDDDEDEEEEEEDDDDYNDDTQLTGLAAKIVRQQKYLRAKVGGVDDGIDDDAEDEEHEKAVWGRKKSYYYDADNRDYELQSSDEELLAEEEEVLRLRKEKAKSLSMEDFGLEDVGQDAGDKEPTFEEILVQGKSASKASSDIVANDDVGILFEEVKKDLNALTREEQMDVVYSSAPELVGLLSELNDALVQLENKVNPLLEKMGAEDAKKGEKNYLQVKKLLLLSYCQAITFYLLLKSEGQSVRDHPVITRLVEIKSLVDKMKQLDENLPSNLEDILNKNVISGTVNSVSEDVGFNKDGKPSLMPVETQVTESWELAEPATMDHIDHEKKRSKSKHQDNEVGLQSIEMLKLRASLEEKLKQKGLLSSVDTKHEKLKKRQRPVNGKLETFDDFDDDAMDIERGMHSTSTGDASQSLPSRLSQLVTPQVKKPKVISGDDDLPRRDDIGERRRKHELRVLAGAGVYSADDADDEPGLVSSNGVANDDLDGHTESESDSDSDLEFYKQVEREHAAKIAAKAEMYSRPSKDPSMPEPVVDGKRQITYQMEKNRGLTRARKKLTKNPRKKYKLKHQKAVVRRKGQVREIKKPSGPYGGETTGINTGISRSIRFKS